jgi:hypothetical protein
MTDTGLSNRLRQHSRRSGIAVGLTMAVTIALCILSSAYIFGRIEPYVAEVTGYDDTTAVPQVAEASNNEPDSESNGSVEEDANESGADPTQASEDEQPTIAGASETDSAEAFVVSHRSNPDFTINFRPGPSVSSGDPIGSLDPSSPLMYLDEEALDEEGVVWLKFRTESGQEGWIREVDTEAVIQ